jgi:hypothetical protein
MTGIDISTNAKYEPELDFCFCTKFQLSPFPFPQAKSLDCRSVHGNPEIDKKSSSALQNANLEHKSEIDTRKKNVGS